MALLVLELVRALGFSSFTISFSLTLYPPDLSPLLAIQQSARRATERALSAAKTRLLEPIMRSRIRIPEGKVGLVVKNLTGAKRASIVDVDSSNGDEARTTNLESYRIVDARVPLAEMLGYASTLRGLTGGAGLECRV